MNTFLDKILAAKRREVESLKKEIPVSALERRPLYQELRRPFRQALERAAPFAIIAELKKASPSKGLLCPDFDVATLARQYQAGGAAALSVLTEREYFLGGLENLEIARAQTGLPLLRKDFLFEEYQLHEARAAGADCVLLIVAALPKEQLDTLVSRAHDLDLEVLVEVHDAPELDLARDCGADIIGVNNRNLKSFEVSLETSLQLAQSMPAHTCSISESGLRTHEDLRKLADAGYSGFLIGETLVTSGDPGRTLQQLLGGNAS